MRTGRSYPHCPHPVGHTLRAISRWAVAAAFTSAAVGCGHDEPWTAVACESGRVNLLKELHLARPVDYLKLYSVHWLPVRMPGKDPYIPSDGEWGNACEKADDREACSAALRETLDTFAECDTTDSCSRFAIWTQGDAVGRFDRAGFLAALGAIDTPSEAMAMAAWYEQPVACDDGPLAGLRARADGDDYEVKTEWGNCQAQRTERVTRVITSAGESEDVDVERIDGYNCQVGRRPAGLVATTAQPTEAPATLATYFAQLAHLEAASVHAFERMARELVALSAPADLVARAARSARDEVRHARLCTRLARRFGAEPEPVCITPPPTRKLFEIALENAVEGCVRETYGALVAQHQAACAMDVGVRKAFQGIAADETRHAELSWDVARYLEPLLDVRQRAQLSAARRSALRQLEDAVRRQVLPPSAAEDVGHPTPATSRRMLAGLERTLLS
ncbi:MAG: hypothetical protein RL701_682 [Pseudomonadota bacterium]|jgi:hypothetical protein